MHVVKITRSCGCVYSQWANNVCTSQDRILYPLFNFLWANLLTQPVDYITLLLLRMVWILFSEVVPYPSDHERAQLGLAKEGYLYDFRAVWEEGYSKVTPK